MDAMNRTKTLLDLQSLDLRRDEAVHRLREVIVALSGDDQIDALRSAVVANEEALADIERRLRSNNLERQGLKEHIAVEEKTLYGGTVKNSKELQNLQLEVNSLKKRLSDLDDVSLEIMMERDEAAEADEASRQSLRVGEATAKSDQAALTAERTKLARQIRELDTVRKATIAGLATRELALYEAVRSRKVGKAVAVVNKDTCGGCGMQLPRHLLDAVYGNSELVQCPTCRRILVT